MSSRLPGILFIAVIVLAIAGVGYYAVASLGNYEIGAENARLAAITTAPTPVPTISPQTTGISMKGAGAPVTTAPATAAPTAALPSTPLKSTVTLSAGPGTHIERFTAQAKGKISVTITHIATKGQTVKCSGQSPLWVLAGTTINDITLENQEVFQTTTTTTTLPGTGTVLYNGNVVLFVVGHDIKRIKKFPLFLKKKLLKTGSFPVPLQYSTGRTAGYHSSRPKP